MNWAVISDIHCNYVALLKAVKDALSQGVSKFIFLGDYVTDGYCGNEIIAFLKELSLKCECIFIYGNREKYIKSYHDVSDEENRRVNRKALGYESLSAQSLEWINNLKETQIIEIDGLRVLLIHGDNFKRAIDITYNYQMLIDTFDFDVCLFGHIHEPKNDNYKGKRFINPGTISYPENNSSLSYCIIDFSDHKINVIPRSIRINQDILDIFIEQLIKTGFYQDNPIWSELLINYARDSINYISMFIVPFNRSIPNIRTISAEEYNRLFEEKYIEFAKQRNFDRINSTKKKQ